MTARYLSRAARTVDARSTRSRQRKVGASEIGVCRRRAGYSHHGHPQSDPENGSGVAAINGTWIHKGALDVMRREWGSLIETRVENDILRGHIDALDLPNEWRVRAGMDEHPLAPDVIEVEDLKTKRDGRLVGFVRNRGPQRSELFQGHLYAGMLRRGEVSTQARFAGLAALGPLPVETVRLRYWSRAGEQDDDVQEFPYEQPFDPAIEEEALEWVRQVAASTSPDDLPRDQDGPGLSIVCDNCPFVTACWGAGGTRAPQTVLVVTDADLAATLADYDDARTTERDAKAKKDLARAKLDGTDPAIYTDGADRTYRIHWSGGKTADPKPDVPAMLALFEKAQIGVPYLEPHATGRTIQLTRWEVPEAECGKPVGDTEPVTIPDPSPAGDHVVVYLQDRPRGGWTRVDHEGNEATFTAGEFARIQPNYVDPRPPCVLKKAHSGPCWPHDTIRVLDVDPDAAGPSDDA